MDRFDDVLRAGGRSNSLGRSGDVLQAVRDDPHRATELFDCILDEDPWVRMRAVDCFEKLVRAGTVPASPFLDRIFSDLLDSPQPSVQWHLAQIFAMVELPDHQREVAIGWLRTTLSTTAVDWIVSAHAMTALERFEECGYVDAAVVDELLEVQLGHRSVSVRRKASARVERRGRRSS